MLGTIATNFGSFVDKHLYGGTRLGKARQCLEDNYVSRSTAKDLLDSVSFELNSFYRYLYVLEFSNGESFKVGSG